MENNIDELKSSIINAAVRLYIEERTRFTLRNIAEEAGCEVGDIQQFFSGKQAILRGFYDQIPDVYRSATADIPDFETLNFGEKAANYIYTTFDVLSINRDFTEETFDSMVISRSGTYWHEETKVIFREMIEHDTRIPGANTFLIRDFVYDILAKEYMQLIRFWLQDDSRGTERTLALVDKLTGFANELLYSGVIDKGFDLGKYLVSNDIWKFRFKESFAELDGIRNRLWDIGAGLRNDVEDAARKFKQSVDEQCGSGWSRGMDCGNWRYGSWQPRSGTAGSHHKAGHHTHTQGTAVAVEIPVMDDESDHDSGKENDINKGRKSGQNKAGAKNSDDSQKGNTNKDIQPDASETEDNA